MTTTITPTWLDEIDGRIDAAAVRAAETFANLPPTRLLSRADADRNRLVRDGRTMSLALRAILAEHEPLPGVTINAATLAERDTVVCDPCGSEWPCRTVQIVQGGTL
jgi:hypothetical protein